MHPGLPEGEPSAEPVLPPSPVVEQLEEEISQLKHALTAHAVVDQAIGIVVAVTRLTPQQGWLVLQDVSQRQNVKLRLIAEMVVDWGQTGELPPSVEAALDRAVERQRSVPEPRPVDAGPDGPPAEGASD